MYTRVLAPLALAAASVAFSGCGVLTKDLEGNVVFGFTIDEMDSRYESVETFDPNSNEDVKKNRSRVEEATILAISLSFIEILPNNSAYQVAGQVDVKKKSQSEWLMAVGQWQGIPLYDDWGTRTPATNQKVKLDLPLETQAELSNLVFEGEEPLDFRLNGYGYDEFGGELGPVAVRGEVDVSLSLKVSAP